ncbi:MAG TPA: pyridoxamine 5'-phosphate oxidase family protein, partial [Bryobacteraceae bacterium]|nr:pyridoxamine 5'-phosphate oxidase family protein [Bryobacteraceae bacterium]
LLKSQSTLSLATTDADGTPRIAPLFYLSDGLRLYWFSSASSDHSKNLERNSAAAVTVYRPTSKWEEIRGVQMRGRVSVVADSDQRQSIGKAYTDRFELGTLFDVLISRTSLYVFQPAWVRYLDNSKHVGYKVERKLEA